MSNQNASLTVRVGVSNVQASMAQVKAFATGITSAFKTLAVPLAGVASLGGIVAGLKSAITAADDLFKESQKIGVATDRLSALEHAAKLSNVSLDELRIAAKNVSEDLRKSGETSRTFLDVLLQSADEFNQMPDGLAKTDLAVQRFGKSGQALIPLLNQGSEAIREQMREAAQLGVVISTDFGRKAEEFNDNLTRVKEALRGVFLGLAETILPDLVPLTNALVQVAKDFGIYLSVVIKEFANGNGPQILGLSIQAGFELGIEAGRRLFGDFFGPGNLLRLLANGFFTAVYSLMKETWSLSFSFAVQMIETLAIKLAAEFQNAIDRIEWAFRTMFAGVANFFRAALEAIINDAIQKMNRLPGVNIAPVLLGRVAGPGPAPERGSGTTWAEAWNQAGNDARAASQFIRDWFDETIVEVRKLIGVGGAPGGPSAVDKIRELLDAEKQRREQIGNTVAGVPGSKGYTPGHLGEEQGLMAPMNTGPVKPGSVPDTGEHAVWNPFSFREQMFRVMTELQDAWGTWSIQIAETLRNTFDTAVSSISNGITGLIMQTKTWGQALQQIGSTILTSIVQAIVQMVTRWIVGQIAMTAASVAGSTSRATATAGETAAQAPLTAAKAADSVANIPYVGWALAIAAFAGVMAMILSARAQGGPVVAGRPYLVGELGPELVVPQAAGTVIPADVTASTLSGGGGGASVNTQVHLGFFDTKRAALEALRDEDGQVFLVDFMRRNLHQITGRA